jgi:DNA-binding FadR family transcriptional regulator
MAETLGFEPTDEAPEQRTRNFHLLVLSAAGNPMIELMARPVFDLLRVRYIELAASTGFWSQVKHDHSQIYEAVADADPDAAASAMASHLDDLISTYQQLQEAIDRTRSR